MSIRFSCPSCDREYSVADQYAGKRTTCTACQAKIVVPLSQIRFSPPPESVSTSAPVHQQLVDEPVMAAVIPRVIPIATFGQSSTHSVPVSIALGRQRKSGGIVIAFCGGALLLLLLVAAICVKIRELSLQSASSTPSSSKNSSPNTSTPNGIVGKWDEVYGTEVIQFQPDQTLRVYEEDVLVLTGRYDFAESGLLTAHVSYGGNVLEFTGGFSGDSATLVTRGPDGSDEFYHRQGTTPAVINATDADQTLRWIVAHMRHLDEVALQRNELVLAEEKDQIIAELQQLMGKQVLWTLPVAAVSKHAVYADGDLKRLFLVLAKEVLPSKEVRKLILDGQYGSFTMPVLIGQGISPKRAADLTKGDLLSLIFEVQSIDVTQTTRYLPSGPQSAHAIRFEVTSGQAVP